MAFRAGEEAGEEIREMWQKGRQRDDRREKDLIHPADFEEEGPHGKNYGQPLEAGSQRQMGTSVPQLLGKQGPQSPNHRKMGSLFYNRMELNSADNLSEPGAESSPGPPRRLTPQLGDPWQL